MKLLEEKCNHVVDYKLKPHEVNWFAEVWKQTVYSQTVWNPDAALGTQTLMFKMGCDKYHIIKLKVGWPQKKESDFWLENVRDCLER